MALTKITNDGVDFSGTTDINIDSGTFVVDASTNRVGVGTTSPGRTLDVNGVIRVDGTSAALAFGGNSSTPAEGCAIHRPASDQMAFVTNNTERLRIDSSGNVGINQTPTRELSLHSPNNNNSYIHFTNDDTGETSADGALVGIDGNEDLNVNNQESGKNVIFRNAGERMRIHSNGNLSLGATTNDSVGSTTTLTIDRASGNGQLSVAANGTVRGRIFADNSTSELRIGNPTANDLMLYTNNTERLRVDSSGRLLLGTTTEGHSSADDLTIADSGDVGITLRSTDSNQTQISFSDGTTGDAEYRGQISYFHTDDYMRFRTNAVERLRIANNGAWGLAGANYGSSGQVLTSQGSGSAPQWATPSGATWSASTVNPSSSSGIIAFTSIPSDIDMFMLSWSGLNSSSNQEYYVELGYSGTYQTSGYVVSSGYFIQGGTSGVTRYSSNFYWRGSGTGGATYATMWFLRDGTGNAWSVQGMMNDNSDALIYVMSGRVSLSGTLDRARIVLSSGNFDALGGATLQYLQT